MGTVDGDSGSFGCTGVSVSGSVDIGCRARPMLIHLRWRALCKTSRTNGELGAHTATTCNLQGTQNS
eukprot:5804652-Amphidinium_carterae.3